MNPLRIVAYGKPITQGSKTRTKFAMRDSNAATLKPWRDNVRSAALEAIGEAPRIEGPVIVRIWFFFDRPLAHYGTGKSADILKPAAPGHPDGRKSGDIDKLQRAAFDALTDAGVWKDDSQIVSVIAMKRFTSPLGFDKPGVSILVSQLPDGCA